MGEITTIGVDLAKHVFQVHGIDAEGTTVLRKQLRRGQVLLTKCFPRNADGMGISYKSASRDLGRGSDREASGAAP
jgi:hypothetical protein